MRMALGAAGRDILGLVVRQGLVLAADRARRWRLPGGGRGLALRALLAGVSPFDAVTFAAAVLVVLLTTLLGCLRPALRAVRVDPLIALRAD